MRELSMHELAVVSGAVGPVGAASGAASYIGYASGSGQGSVAGLLGAVVVGGVVGFVSGPVGVTALQNGALTVVGTQVGFYSGMSGGLAERAFNSAGTNYGTAAAGTNYN
jgi:hypothetical protein